MDTPSNPLKKFDIQIRTLSRLVQDSAGEEVQLVEQLKEVQKSALSVLSYFHIQKDQLLEKFDALLLPIAKEVLEEMTHDAELLNHDLEKHLNDLTFSVQADWIDQAKGWASLYARWHDEGGVVNLVLRRLSEKAKHSIEKDLKLIDDYQKHSIAHLSPDTDECRDVEQRLKAATADALQRLSFLKDGPKDLSLEQAAEWLKTLREEREMHFGDLLKRIDQVVEEVGRWDECQDPVQLTEIEHEILFMEQELKEIEVEISSANRRNQMELALFEERLDGLQQHLEQLVAPNLPEEFALRLEQVKSRIDAAFKRLSQA